MVLDIEEIIKVIIQQKSYWVKIKESKVYFDGRDVEVPLREMREPSEPLDEDEKSIVKSDSGIPNWQEAEFGVHLTPIASPNQNFQSELKSPTRNTQESELELFDIGTKEGILRDSEVQTSDIWLTRSKSVSSPDESDQTSSMESDWSKQVQLPLQTIEEEDLDMTTLETDLLDEEFPSILKSLSIGKRHGRPRKVPKTSNFFDYSLKAISKKQSHRTRPVKARRKVKTNY